MNKLIIIISAMLLAVNLFAGGLFPSYKPFNICFTSVTILVTALMLCLLNIIQLKTAFRVSLYFLFTICGLAGFILGLYCDPVFIENKRLIATLLVFVGEVSVLLICSLTSKTIK